MELEMIDDPILPMSELRLATNNFSEENLMKQTPSVVLYKGHLDQSGQSIPIVVRRYTNPDVQWNEAWISLVTLHKNVATLFKYEVNESLDKHLSGSTLTWTQRLHICVDLARGLSHIHNGDRVGNSIIHGNIKSSKILLNQNWEPTLHGLRADMMIKKHGVHNPSNYDGTLQYTDPAYEKTRGLSHKSDVYSFGVVLFEVLLGRVASIPISDQDNWSFARFARSHYERETLSDIIDPVLRQQMDSQSLENFSETAYYCLLELRSQRPDMIMVVKKLERALDYQQKLESPEHSTTASVEAPLSNQLKGKNLDHLRISLSDITSATDNFSETCRIGKGGYGTVYKAELRHFDGSHSSTTEGVVRGDFPERKSTVAVKHISKRVDKQGEKGFLAEIEMLSKCKHKNVKRDNLHVSLKDIQVATQNFSDDKCIEEGRYWKQYEGQIPLANANEHTVVIVKRFDNMSDEGRERFLAEIKVLVEFKHKNIIALVGYCTEMDERIICYEHATNGRFSKYVQDASLTWMQRIKICIDMASGLSFLHKDDDANGMIHSDIKSDSILLDAEWNAKISNLELASIYWRTEKWKHDGDDYGSLGFMDPTRKVYVEKKSDWYSFSMILLEMFCGRYAKNLEPWSFYKDTFLVCASIKDFRNRVAFEGIKERWASIEDFINEVAFEGIKEQISAKSCKKFFQVALNCGIDKDDWRVIERLEEALEAQACEDHEIWEPKLPTDYQEIIDLSKIKIKVLVEFKHKNIIALVGYCTEMDERIICYEHVTNGRFSKYVQDASLTWMQRIKICIDMASGLSFLHKEDDQNGMIHSDIKSGSILLDAEWNAKISNLELASTDWKAEKWKHDGDDYGSLGFMDPTRKVYVEKESDWYSFSMILLEMFCGRYAKDLEPWSFYTDKFATCASIEDFINQVAFEGMKEQISAESCDIFFKFALECGKDKDGWHVIGRLEKALGAQEDHEIWEPKLPRDYQKILKSSKIEVTGYSKKGLYELLCKGVLLKKDNWFFSLGSNGKNNEMISARKFSFKNSGLYKWRSTPESRFSKVAKIYTIWNLKMNIKIRTQFLSPGVNYGVHLVFKFCGPRKFSSKSLYVNLTYNMGNETLHTYFATRRDEDWMMVELGRFLNHEGNMEFKALLESFSQYYCERKGIYVEGIEFRAIHDANMDQVQQLATGSTEFSKRSANDDESGKALLLNEVNEKKHLMLSVKEVLYDSSKVKCVKLFHLKPSEEPRFQEVIELLPRQVFSLKCKIQSQMLLPDTDYMCYLMFKLSEKCHGLHCPVKVKDVLHWKNKEMGILYFRTPSPWNVNDNNRVPEKREDGWMEVIVWKFNSTSDLRKDYIPMHLKLIAYEGTMSGLIVGGLEIRPVVYDFTILFALQCRVSQQTSGEAELVATLDSAGFPAVILTNLHELKEDEAQPNPFVNYYSFTQESFKEK
ncbi:serine/threonine-protein kinase, active site protein [Artemisia annua]|uniref:Serine/threonine-protein kinase, active site protein n=1 Tax=Artemisia annua TaxID=35608 RepID=A0A2U1QDX3_ARTAN|nr:serine/threonine-protein kinase, active site protein [Artemisia annua]